MRAAAEYGHCIVVYLVEYIEPEHSSCLYTFNMSQLWSIERLKVGNNDRKSKQMN